MKKEDTKRSKNTEKTTSIILRGYSNVLAEKDESTRRYLYYYYMKKVNLYRVAGYTVLGIYHKTLDELENYVKSFNFYNAPSVILEYLEWLNEYCFKNWRLIDYLVYDTTLYNGILTEDSDYLGVEESLACVSSHIPTVLGASLLEDYYFNVYIDNKYTNLYDANKLVTPTYLFTGVVDTETYGIKNIELLAVGNYKTIEGIRGNKIYSYVSKNNFLVKYIPDLNQEELTANLYSEEGVLGLYGRVVKSLNRMIKERIDLYSEVEDEDSNLRSILYDLTLLNITSRM